MHNVHGAQGKSKDVESSDDATFQSMFTQIDTPALYTGVDIYACKLIEHCY